MVLPLSTLALSALSSVARIHRTVETGLAYPGSLFPDQFLLEPSSAVAVQQKVSLRAVDHYFACRLEDLR